MKVLYIANNLLAGNSGGNFATRAFVNAFSEIADSCKLLYPDKGQNITSFVHRKTIKKGIPNNKPKLLKLLDIYRGKINRYVDILIPEIISYQPDIVVFDGSISSALLIKKIKSLNKKIITIHHNYEMEYYKGTPQPILWRVPFMHYMKKTELEAIQYSNLNLTLTSQDAMLLRKHYDPENKATIEVIGCFESTPISFVLENSELFKANQQERKKNIDFVITGSLGSRQTEASIFPFLKHLHPIILKIFPQSRLFIAGKNPSPKLIKTCRENRSISLIANPKDMQSIINQADIYICPTSLGGGLKLRIMDGLKSGLPVLTHAVSARGYDDFEKAGYLFKYTDKLTFEKSLNQLVLNYQDNKINRQKIAELYSEVFSFENGVNKLELLIENNLKHD